MAIKPPVTMPKTDRELFRWLLDAYDLRLKFGAGSPLNVVTADRGTLYMRTDGGANTTLYVKEGNDGTSLGWVAK
jgi:hypothetical protein